MEQTESANSDVGADKKKRRYRTKQERRRIVEELLVPGAKASVVAKAHDVRASQVNHWRRLYREGLLKDEPSVTALMPVRILDAQRGTATAERVTQGQPCQGRASTGTIQLTLAKAHLQIEGAVDASSLRLVLEHLLR